MDDVQLFLEYDLKKPTATWGTLTVRTANGEVLMVDRIDITKEKSRAEFIDKLVQENPGLDKQEQRNQIGKLLLAKADEQVKQAQQCEAAEAGDEDEPLVRSQKLLEATDKNEIEYANELLKRPDLVDIIVGHVHKLGVAGEEDLILALYGIGTSRLLARPLGGIVLGASSAGKSYLIDNVAKLFPPEAVLRAHRMTPRALEHFPPGYLKHRFVVAGERSRLQDDQAAEATRALREMMSEGRLSLASAERSAQGVTETRYIEREGPIAYVESTTLGSTQIFDEDRTRMVVLTSDEAPKQTQAIIESMAQAAAVPIGRDEPDTIVQLHHTCQRLLEPCNVIVPYAEKLGARLPTNRVEMRRSWGHLLGWIKTLALLHQRQRERDSSGNLLSTVEDYAVVYARLLSPLARSLGLELTPGAQTLLGNLDVGQNFMASELSRKMQVSDNTVRSRLKELEHMGLVECVQASRGRQPAIYQCVSEQPPSTSLGLPKPEELREVKTAVVVPELVADKT